MATIRDGGVQGCLVLHRPGVEPLRNEREANFLLSLLRFDVVDLVAIPAAIGYAGDMSFFVREGRQQMNKSHSLP